MSFVLLPNFVRLLLVAWNRSDLNFLTIICLSVISIVSSPCAQGGVSDRVPQRVDSGLSTSWFPLSNTLQRYEELVGRCLSLSIIVYYCLLLSKICNEFSCEIRIYFVTLCYNYNKQGGKKDEKLFQE